MPLSDLSSLSSLADISGASGSTQAAPAPAVSSGPAWLTGALAQYVAILLGLILIGAGLFSFRPVRETVVKIGKGAGEAASVA